MGVFMTPVIFMQVFPNMGRTERTPAGKKRYISEMEGSGIT
jgi:hypothetical protein